MMRLLIALLLAFIAACSATSPARLCTTPLVPINPPVKTPPAPAAHPPAEGTRR
jgi:hypothetical protein